MQQIKQTGSTTQ